MTMAESCKLRYDLLRIKRRCVECTKRLPKDWNKVRCPKHHGTQLAYHRKWRKEKSELAERVKALEVAVSGLGPKRAPSSQTLPNNPPASPSRNQEGAAT